MGLPTKIVMLHDALRRADIPHAFGGALALAWCTQRARGTIDIDLNVFVESQLAGDVLAALPEGPAWTESDRALVERDGQARLWWGTTPVDVFLNTTAFHQEAAGRVRWEAFAGGQIPFLSCADLAVFKAFFNRSKDWVDLEEMAVAGTLDVDRVVGVLVRFLGATDERIDRLLGLLEAGR
ncbi:MAG: hypothetical protein ACRDY7_18860 [Acidimicrobiia bacterium]